MKRKLSVVLIMVSVMLVVFASSVIAKQPLTGTMDLQFNMGWTPGGTDPIWVGNVTIDETPYGMAFFVTGSGKPFDEDPNTTVHFFAETWVIYESLDFAFSGDIPGVCDDCVLSTFVEGPILLSGPDRGVTNLANSTYRMNGNVEVANGPFAMWQGRNVHMSGDVEWYPFGAPVHAPGTFRIN